MNLLHLRNKTIVVARLATVSGDKMALVTATSCLAHVQPIAPDKVQSFGGVYGKSYRMWFDPASDVQEGDTLRDSDGNYYEVRKGGVTKHAFGSIEYREVLVTLK
jgi:hypothetical protein